jgi:excisionase family DNA binding protein
VIWLDRFWGLSRIRGEVTKEVKNMASKKHAAKAKKAKITRHAKSHKTKAEAKTEAKSNGSNGHVATMQPVNGAQKLLTTHEAAELISVSSSSIVKWMVDGGLKGFKTPGGHRRVLATDLKAFLEKSGSYVPPALVQAATA